MGYCGIKIAGHTGTDFKNKKAFTRSKKFLNHKSKIANVRIESREPKKDFKQFLNIKRSIAFLLIIVCTIILSMFIYRIDVLSIQREQISIQYEINMEVERKSTENLFLNNLLGDAEMQYQNEKYTRAHEKLYALLLVDENNNPAEKLLIKVLKAKCEKFDIGCNQLEYYSKYLEQKYTQIN